MVILRSSVDWNAILTREPDCFGKGRGATLIVSGQGLVAEEDEVLGVFDLIFGSGGVEGHW